MVLNEDFARKFEIHYFLDQCSHSFDAFARLECETELLGIVKEIARYLNVDVIVESEALVEGGVRNRWRFTSKDDVLLIVAVLTLVLTFVQTINSFPTENEKIIQELTIKKLEAELKQLGVSDETSYDSAKKVSELENNNKIKKRRSNFYASAMAVDKVTDIGVTVLDAHDIPINDELVVSRKDFGRFILHSNNLPDETDESAIIEIVSPVLKDGKTKWRGIYNDEPITFNMKDSDFKKDVLLGKYTFQHGTVIEAVLVIQKELDEVGEEKIVDRSVTTVIKKIDAGVDFETPQGKNYKHVRNLKAKQQEIVFSNEKWVK
ncbi:hypothetical protein [Thiomicrorhabdus cannonii]|uniref:hypothetical protein n=1 Tax=Thiomicrorhabdus cannonii TaxID=2748011 RepID=UPI0015C1193F|nr:hypothetical protein [Thiomicrorhabdus cannonii]